jgi:CRP-like cAMP-binding protein
VLELFDPVTAKAGRVIVHQDDLGDCMFVVVHGRLRVCIIIGIENSTSRC